MGFHYDVVHFWDSRDERGEWQQVNIPDGQSVNRELQTLRRLGYHAVPGRTKIGPPEGPPDVLSVPEVQGDHGREDAGGEEVMSEIEVYSFEDADGVEDGYTTQDPVEARERARRYGLRLIAHTFSWSDSEVLEDHTDRAGGIAR